ncbi:hypothetical protein DPMN_095460 [Dreissena polymorpha]|uniref:Uncharacterized protein n=1 Tax=Dreissena polymorpha TaxID=45954 RepID=A0A9D4L7X4_DREPO|nr:hypothetical protein DPMN_095460 [Dreissena polymorpha]
MTSVDRVDPCHTSGQVDRWTGEQVDRILAILCRLLSSGNHLVDGRTYGRTDRHTQRKKIILKKCELIHENWTTKVSSRLKEDWPINFHYSHIRKTALPSSGQFHEDWTINVASRELTTQMLTTHDGQMVITKAHHEHILLR